MPGITVPPAPVFRAGTLIEWCGCLLHDRSGPGTGRDGVDPA